MSLEERPRLQGSYAGPKQVISFAGDLSRASLPDAASGVLSQCSPDLDKSAFRVVAFAMRGRRLGTLAAAIKYAASPPVQPCFTACRRKAGMFKDFATYYSPEQLGVLDSALETAMRELAPKCSAGPDFDRLRRALATAVLRVAENGITDAERMADAALHLMRQAGSFVGSTAAASHPQDVEIRQAEPQSD